MKSKYGFTLVELLIVVAVIAIVAAIAVPNLLNAQTRAKIARAKADMKTIQTAAYQFFIDQPTENSRRSNYFLLFHTCSLYEQLTTPINYISSFHSAHDIFAQPRMEGEIYRNQECYMYSYSDYFKISQVTGGLSFEGKVEYLYSIGPDLKREQIVLNLPIDDFGKVYQSSNGLLSSGDLHFQYSN